MPHSLWGIRDLPIKKISREQVHGAAEKLHKRREKITTDGVRALLQAGSKTTILKYLNEWKELNANDLESDPKKLTKKLVDQQKINQSLTQELIAQTQALSDAKKQIEILRAQNTKLTEDVSVACKERDMIQSTYQGQIESMQSDFEKSLKLMAEQIKKINAHAIDQVVAAGHHFDEHIIEERMQIRDLKAQLNMKSGKKRVSHVD